MLEQWMFCYKARITTKSPEVAPDSYSLRRQTAILYQVIGFVG